MKTETMDKALDLREKLREVDGALEHWEKAEQPQTGGAPGRAFTEDRFPKHLHDADAYQRYRRAQIDHLVRQRQDLQRQFEAL